MASKGPRKRTGSGSPTGPARGKYEVTRYDSDPGVIAGDRRCTGADLLALLSRLPRPDEDFLNAVEEISRNQSPVAKSPWKT